MRNLTGHTGSNFDEFLRQEGILEQSEAIAVKRVIAWRLQQAMRTKRVTKQAMARRLRTSRSQLDRLLDPTNTAVSLGTITRAATVLGKRIKVQITDAETKTRGHERRRKRRVPA